MAKQFIGPGGAVVVVGVPLAILTSSTLAYCTALIEASNGGTGSPAPEGEIYPLPGDDRPVTMDVVGLPFQIKVTTGGVPPQHSIALAAFEKQKRMERRRSATAKWFSGLKSKLLQLPFFNIRRGLKKRLQVYEEAGATYKSLLGKALTGTELASYYGLGGLLALISLPFKLIGYTLSTAFQPFFGTSEKQYKARMNVLRAERDEANSFYKEEVRQEKELAEIARNTRTLTSAILDEIGDINLLRLPVDQTNLKEFGNRIQDVYTVFKEKVRSNTRLQMLARGDSSRFAGRIRERLIYSRSVRKGAESRLFTAFIAAVKDASFSREYHAGQVLDPRSESAAGLADLFLQMVRELDLGHVKDSERLLTVRWEFLTERSTSEIASNLSSFVVGQRFETISLLQRLLSTDGRTTFVEQQVQRVFAALAEGVPGLQQYPRFNELCTRLLRKTILYLVSHPEKGTLLTPEEVRRSCRGNQGFVDPVLKAEGEAAFLDTRFDYFAYIYRGQNTADPGVELKRCVSADNVYRLIGTPNFFAVPSEAGDVPAFVIEDFRLVKGFMPADPLHLPLRGRVSAPSASASPSVLPFTRLTPVQFVGPRVTRRVLRETFEQCGFEYPERPTLLQRVTGPRPKHGLRAALSSIRVNGVTFRGEKIFHEALWRALRSYLSGEVPPGGVNDDAGNFFPRDPTVAFLDRSFRNLAADSGITAYVEEGATEGTKPPSRRLIELASGLEDRQLYTPAQAAEAWREAMLVKIRSLETVADRIRFDVSMGIVQQVCHALKNLAPPSRDDPAVVDELFRLYGLDSPESPAPADVSCDAVVGRKKAKGISSPAFAVRGMGKRRSRIDPLLPFRLLVEKTLKELGAGGLVPFVAQFLLASPLAVAQVHSVVARINKETVRGYLAEKFLGAANKRAGQEPEALFKQMKTTFFKMFELKVEGLRHKNGMDCFQNKAIPWSKTGQWSGRGSLFEQPFSNNVILPPSSSVDDSDCEDFPGRFSDVVEIAIQQRVSRGYSDIVFNRDISGVELEELARTGGQLHDADELFAEQGDTSLAVFRDVMRIQNNPVVLAKSLGFLRKYFGNPSIPPPPKVTRPAMLKALAHQETDGYVDGFESDFVVRVIWKFRDAVQEQAIAREGPGSVFQQSEFQKTLIAGEKPDLPFRFVAPFPLRTGQAVKRQGVWHKFFYDRFRGIPGGIILFGTIGAAGCLAGSALCASIFLSMSPFYGSQMVGLVGLLAGAGLSVAKMLKWYVYSTAQLALQHLLWSAIDTVTATSSVALAEGLPSDKRPNLDTMQSLANTDETRKPFLLDSTPAASLSDSNLSSGLTSPVQTGANEDAEPGADHPSTRF
ncbi:transmembrane protein [Cystoisospora suis]|uniref:Transmembrane protein n=1 Tax=Cystoisospora suis TaxID=483139 RepID=A0A2C6KB30_9APIC|nr:transmembrane protein [Cystoisospora suis]